MLTRRGQIHRFETAQDISGAVIRFGDELLHARPGSPSDPARLFSERGVLTLDVPPEESEHLDAVIRALAAESRRPADAHSTDIHRHLLMTPLSWAERRRMRAPSTRPETPADLRLARLFAETLERDFPRHHDVGHYARHLHVSTGALWRALSRATGHPPRTLITERVMVEAARLLRFTDMPVGAVAERVGVKNRLYFSRVPQSLRRGAPRLPGTPPRHGRHRRLTAPHGAPCAPSPATAVRRRVP
ncbi:helix-turn-helix domain-containing protein [Streptomyces massasporeus]|uniref:helix-turn-helix transcriptional regulator n=1 Tax=Streptomyces massasporeus TaxID=67324 RepID=UPI0034521DB2